MASMNEQLQKIFDLYRQEVRPDPVSLDEVAAWAMAKGLYQPAPKDIIKIFCDDMARSLRQEKRIDAQGREYRAKHCIKDKVGDRQLRLWMDIDAAPQWFMQRSFQERRRAIIGDCHQLKQDVDHYNDINSGSKPIQLVLDFSDDVAELEASKRRLPDNEAA